VQPDASRLFYLANLSQFNSRRQQASGLAVGLTDVVARNCAGKGRSAELEHRRQDQRRHWLRSSMEARVFRIDQLPWARRRWQNLLRCASQCLVRALWRNAHIDHVQIKRKWKQSGWRKSVVTITITLARCATWCRTICCNCCVWWPWKLRWLLLSRKRWRNEKLKILEKALRADHRQWMCQDSTVRGQYFSMAISARVRSYRPINFEKCRIHEQPIPRTFVALKSKSINWRCRGAAFICAR